MPFRHGKMTIRSLSAVLLIAAGLLFTSPAIACAADIREGETLLVGPDEIVRDDLYAFAATVDVQGTVEGDVIAFGGDVTVDGTVTGDVIAAGSRVDVRGNVGGSIRAAGGEVDVSGEIGEDLVAGSGRTLLRDGGRIGRDLVAGAGRAEVRGDVARDLLAGAGTLVIAGDVGGDARISSPDIRFREDGRVAGDLTYYAERREEIPEESVGGEVTFRRTAGGLDEQDTIAGVLFWLLTWIRGLIGMALLALIVTLLFPAFSSASADVMGTRPWPSLGIGVALFFGVPILAFIVFGFGLLVGGWWIGLGLLALYFIALAVAVIVTSVFIGRWAIGLARARRPAPVWWALLGLLLLWIVRLIPILGTLVLWVAILFGLGAAAVAVADVSRRCRLERGH